MKIFYTKEVNRVNSKINKDICLSYETEYYNFITELEKKRYFSHICPIVPVSINCTNIGKNHEFVIISGALFRKLV